MPRDKQRDKQKPDRRREDGKKRGDRRDEEGGESIGVEITVNGKRKFHRIATITGEKNGPQRTYTADSGESITHNRNQGIKKLAKKLIDL